MSPLSCDVAQILSMVLRVFWILMLLYALVSWVPAMQGRWSYYIARIVEPVLIPLRKVIPPVGGLDLSFLIVIVLVSYLITAIPRAVCYGF
jgi:YggT family protein